MSRLPGLADLLQGLAYSNLWLRMGWMDIVRRYRRTRLGPFWSTISIGAFIGATGFMYAGIFRQDPTTYLPYLSSGFTVWIPISTFISEATGAFLAGESTLRQMRIPFSIYIYAAIVRNFIVFGHNITIYIVVIILFPVDINQNTLMVLPGLLLVAVNAVWCGVLVALVCTRYRDLQQAVGTLLQVVFFLTPIFWNPAQAGRAQKFLVDINPFYHFVEIVRAPMLGQAPPAASWEFVIATTFVGYAVTIVAFNRYRNRIVFWL